MAVRKRETFEPVTLGHIRRHGCRDILIYCGSIHCSHSATMNADHWPDDTVVRTLGPKMICTKCGHPPTCGRIGRRTSITRQSGPRKDGRQFHLVAACACIWDADRSFRGPCYLLKDDPRKAGRPKQEKI